jgi:hypothetical protein
MRPRLLACAALLLLTSGLAGCFDRSGTLTVDLAVGDQGAVSAFRELAITLKDVRIKAHTENLEAFPAETTRLDVRSAAGNGQPLEVFKQSVRADTYERIEVTTVSQTYNGTLNDGSHVGVIVPNGVFIALPSFAVPRGGSTGYVLAIMVQEQDSGTGSPTYSIVPDPTSSHTT